MVHACPQRPLKAGRGQSQLRGRNPTLRRTRRPPISAPRFLSRHFRVRARVDPRPYGDGIRRAKIAGVHMDRPPKLTKNQQCKVLARLDRGKEMLTEIARSYAVNHMTNSRIKAQHAAEMV